MSVRFPSMRFFLSCVAVMLPLCAPGAEINACSQGEYYVAALGGYIAIPTRYVEEDLVIEEGIQHVYRSPAPPLLRNCPTLNLASSLGTITVGTMAALNNAARLPKRDPFTTTRIGEFSITAWRFPKSAGSNETLTKVLITKEDTAVVIMDSDPNLWQRVVDSYEVR